MRTDLAAPGKKLAIKGIAAQLLVGSIIIILGAYFEPSMVRSVQLGIMAFLVPHCVFAYWVFRYAGATNNTLVAQSMNQGMKLKLVLTSLIFVIAFSLLHAQPLYLLSAYVITMVTQWTAMFVLSSKL